MCLRYSLAQPEEKLTERYKIKKPVKFKPRYNVAPGQFMPVINNDKPDEIQHFRWGLIPNWSNNESVGMNFINSKGEHIFSKAPFKQIAPKQRCLIPSDGYYEWKKAGKNRVPYRVTMANDSIFSFAGIWDSWENYEGEIIHTFSIITVPSNELVGEIFDRMPLILSPDDEQVWLDDNSSESTLLNLIKPLDSERMSFYASHRVVNSPDFDSPECLQAAPKIYPGETFSLFE